MAAEFVGYTNVRHVQQPEGTELCFASIISAVSEADVPETHRLLTASGISEEDGTTPPMGEIVLGIGDAEISIEPFQSPFDGADNVEGVIKLIDKQFVAGRAVALLHKKNGNPEDERYHWTLLTGYAAHDGQKGAIHAIDPLRERANYFGLHLIESMVARSIDYGGIYAYSIGPVDQ